MRNPAAASAKNLKKTEKTALVGHRKILMQRPRREDAKFAKEKEI
jgi:hypothetical protein